MHQPPQLSGDPQKVFAFRAICNFGFRDRELGIQIDQRLLPLILRHALHDHIAGAVSCDKDRLAGLLAKIRNFIRAVAQIRNRTNIWHTASLLACSIAKLCVFYKQNYDKFQSWTNVVQHRDYDKEKDVIHMELSVSIDQNQLKELLLQIGLVRPVFIWGAPGIGKSAIVEQFAAELVEEKIARHMNSYVRLEKNPVIRAVPLEIKKYFLMLGANLSSRSITAVYSNIGILRFPKEYNQYIDRFGIFASTNSMQLCSCSYENEMVLGFTSKLPKDNIQRNFLNMLKKEEIPYTEKTNNFPGCSLKEKKEAQRIVQVFNFVCIAAAILCGMINYLTREKLDWFWFAAAGCLCGWLIVAVAYAKRRNILKNEIIQLILVTVIAVLWDKYTGWHGWSLDFVLPFGALAVLGSIPVIVKVQKLEKEEYLFYLVQAAFAGLVPLILMFLHLIRFPYPSVVCTGISLLVFAGMFIFNSNDTIREFHKKLRM